MNAFIPYSFSSLSNSDGVMAANTGSTTVVEQRPKPEIS